VGPRVVLFVKSLNLIHKVESLRSWYSVTVGRPSASLANPNVHHSVHKNWFLSPKSYEERRARSDYLKIILLLHSHLLLVLHGSLFRPNLVCMSVVSHDENV
jgi:hypothetical protein